MADTKMEPGQGAAGPGKTGAGPKGGGYEKIPATPDKMGATVSGPPRPAEGPLPTAETAKQKTGEAAEQVERGLNRAEEKLRQAGARAETTFDKAHETVRQTESRARERIDRTGARTNERLEQSAARLDELAGRADAYASQNLDTAGGVKSRAGSVVHGAADVMGSVSRYMRDRDSAALKQDLEEQARRNPLGAVAAGVGIGFLLGRLLR